MSVTVVSLFVVGSVFPLLLIAVALLSLNPRSTPHLLIALAGVLTLTACAVIAVATTLG